MFQTLDITVTQFVNELPNILSYFIPGFIFIKIFLFFSSKDIKHVHNFFIWCIVVSYSSKTIIKFVDSIFSTCFPGNFLYDWTKIFIHIILCIVAALILSCVWSKLNLNRIIDKINHKSINNCIWDDIIDYDLGTTLKVFLKDDITFIGKLISREEKENDSWFVLIDYITIDNKGNEYESRKACEPNGFISTLAFPLSEVKYIELYYTEQTQIFKK